MRDKFGLDFVILDAAALKDLRRTHAISANYLELAQRYARGAFPPPWSRPAP